MNKKILLIGKFPPMQGGISAKTFWLYRQLRKYGFKVEVVTTEVPNYSIPGKNNDPGVHIIQSREIPWHIPYTPILYDRLICESLKVASAFRPDIVETNYLWPYCSVAFTISQIIKKPFLIRHAGSDIQKFKNDTEFTKILEKYFDSASKIVTNNSSQILIEKLCTDKSKVELMPRYIPDPDYFSPGKAAKKYDILFAGKINYFWNQKGAELLLELLKYKNLRALFVINGDYLDKFIKKIDKQNLRGNIEIKNFVHPKEFWKFIRQCKSVWCWEGEGAIEDFSNLVWEACFCDTNCIINSEIKKSHELNFIIKLFPDLILMYNKENVSEFSPDKNENGTIERSEKSELFKNYIHQNILLYESLLK